MTDSDSFVKARYAVTILKTARTSDRPTAAKLIEGLALDLPSPGTPEQVAEAHHKALLKFRELADALRSGRDAGHLWNPAQRAAQSWMNLLHP